jgi:putative ABC transport system permease protein
MVGIAAALVFIGVSMLSPLLARPAAIVLTWPTVRFKSVTGNLARQNVMRNPRRTASTAAALMIGLALVSLIAIVGESSKATFASAIDDQTKTDFILSPTNFNPFSPEAAVSVRNQFAKKFGNPGVVVEWRSGTAEIDGAATEVLGVTPNFRKVSDVPLKGRLDVTALRDGGVVISDSAANDRVCVATEDVAGPKVACRRRRFLPVRFATSTEHVAVPVGGIYTNDKALGSNTNYILGFDPHTDLWEQRFTNALDQFVFVKKPAGASTAQAGAILKTVADEVGGIEAENKAEFKDRQLGQFNQILGLVYVLLLLAVIIALIGIVNTLALSIYERTREIGLLRAVGMTRVQLKRMVRGEAVVVAVFGSILGLVIGVVFGAAIVEALSSEGIIFKLPVGLLVIFLVLSGLAGLLAGSPPARRAAHLDVLRAVNTE